ncbi:MAG TPA: glutamyl-tRNA reductase [Terriglobia bacterium]|nr:glutamyl-tRNA reductase [Terriglobia bacterium]
MQFAVVGVSHRTAPVEVRERLAFSAERLREALASLVDQERISEAMILSTCNRVEIVVQGVASSDGRALEDFLCGYHRIPAESVADHLYSFKNADAIRHIFRVASSLDSMMVGEPQILGQVKEAFRIASDAGTIGMNLSALMNRAFAVAKKVRSETGISQSAVSISYAAVERARKIVGDLAGKTVMIIGASKMGELAARHLRRNGVSSVLVTNRTFDRAVELAKVFEGAAVPFEHFVDHIDRADIVISSTGAPHFIVTKPMAEQIIHRRKNKPIFFIDIAVPRDVDPAVDTINNVFVYDIDDLQHVVDENMKERMIEARRAEEIIATEVRAFCDRMQSREVVPTIVELRDAMERTRREVIERNRKLLRDLPPEEAVDQITQAFANRILHHPIAGLKATANDPNGEEFIEAVRKIFNIRPQ